VNKQQFIERANSHWEDTSAGRIGTPILHVFCIKRWMDANGNSKAKLKFAIDTDLPHPYNMLYSAGQGKLLRLLFCTEFVQEANKWMRHCKNHRETIVYIGDGWPVVLDTIKENIKRNHGLDVHIEFHLRKI